MDSNNTYHQSDSYDQLQSVLEYQSMPLEFRPVRADDASILGDYFLGLSADTRHRYGPHAFDRATAEKLCATTNLAEALRMIAVDKRNHTPRVIAYFILILGVRNDDASRYTKLDIVLNATTDCTLAPSVADEFQSKGLGSLLMARLIEIAKMVGRHRMVLWGGTQATNDRAIHFYHKHGFQTVGEFEEPPGSNNFDMILDL